MEGAELTQIWKAVLGEIEVVLGKNNFGVYFKNSHLISLENGVANMGYKNKLATDQANLRYYSLIQTTLQKISKITPLSLLFETLPETKKEEAEEIGPLFTQPKMDREELAEAVQRARLRADFTFEDFCVSTSNQLAFAAATATAASPGKNYNPLFLWGGVGIGKTHLMQAVGYEILRKNPRARVIYAPCEQFTNEIIEGIRSKNTSAFKNRYRNADALLIDDIQFLSGKDRAQEEFFHTFNAITQNQGQVVLTSDTKPAEIKYIEDRLRSRFEGGMVADISTPDTELKTAICQQKAKKRGIEISNDMAFAIANSAENIRGLEGKIQQIIMFAQTHKREITADLIGEVLKIPVPTTENHLDARVILDKVCEYFELPMKLIKGEKRDKPIVVPRQIVMYLLKTKTAMTYEEIAAFLGGRDHTTIMHGVKKIESLIPINSRIKTAVERIVEK